MLCHSGKKRGDLCEVLIIPHWSDFAISGKAMSSDSPLLPVINRSRNPSANSRHSRNSSLNHSRKNTTTSQASLKHRSQLRVIQSFHSCSGIDEQAAAAISAIEQELDASKPGAVTPLPMRIVSILAVVILAEPMSLT